MDNSTLKQDYYRRRLTVEPELIDERQLKMMANDPEVLGEISAINQEFMITEMDGFPKNED